MEIGWVCVGEGEVGRGPRQLVKHHRVYSGGNRISRCKMAARGGVCSNFPTDYIDLLWEMLTEKWTTLPDCQAVLLKWPLCTESHMPLDFHVFNEKLTCIRTHFPPSSIRHWLLHFQLHLPFYAILAVNHHSVAREKKVTP